MESLKPYDVLLLSHHLARWWWHGTVSITVLYYKKLRRGSYIHIALSEPYWVDPMDVQP